MICEAATSLFQCWLLTDGHAWRALGSPIIYPPSPLRISHFPEKMEVVPYLCSSFYLLK